MKSALAIPFPSESATLVPNPDRWVIGLDHLCTTLEPILIVVREHGKPARVIRQDPDFEIVELKP
jgi:hypothetical protein